MIIEGIINTDADEEYEPYLMKGVRDVMIMMMMMTMMMVMMMMRFLTWSKGSIVTSLRQCSRGGNCQFHYYSSSPFNFTQL